MTCAKLNCPSSPLPARLVAFRPCKKGEQVLLSYGPLPNAKLLLFYGFAMDANPFDAVVFPAEVCGWGWGPVCVERERDPDGCFWGGADGRCVFLVVVIWHLYSCGLHQRGGDGQVFLV
jgi:hypothetical protein